jgi:SPP1 gp7 family putative phage head morphogenesis protein
MPLNVLYTGLKTEYERTKLTLVKHASRPSTKKAVRKFVHATLALCTERQSHQCTKLLPRSFRAGFDLESKSIKAHVKKYGAKKEVTSAAAMPAIQDIAFDFSKVSKTHLNRITRDTIGHIGQLNKGISKSLMARYDDLVINNALVNSIAERGFTQHTESQLLKQGVSKELVKVIKNQSTTSKMISILEKQGIMGGMHPDSVASLLIPEIRTMFGSGGVSIDNIGKMRKVLRVNAAGEYWWDAVKVKQLYHTTTENYANLISATAMKRAQNEGRLASMRQSGLVEKYRYISQQTGNTCITCLGMHGLIVDPTDVCPPIHVKCYCTLAPVYKDHDLNLHGDEYYMKQKDAGIWRKYQFEKYNKGLSPADRIPNPNFLPPEWLKGMPRGAKMDEIRATVLG